MLGKEKETGKITGRKPETRRENQKTDGDVQVGDISLKKGSEQNTR